MGFTPALAAQGLPANTEGMNSKMLRGPYCDVSILMPGGARVRCGADVPSEDGYATFQCTNCAKKAVGIRSSPEPRNVHIGAGIGITLAPKGEDDQSCPRCRGVSINGIHLVRHACIEELQKQVTELKQMVAMIAKRMI